MKFIQAIIAIGFTSIADGKETIFGKAKARPILTPQVPPKLPPQLPPVLAPTHPPSQCDLTCEVDADCPSVCEGASTSGGYGGSPTPGTCVPSSSPNTQPPTICPCVNPSEIPDKCEVEILIDMMETFVMAEHKLAAQWTRAAFHDAGTFDQSAPEGGANGCLLNFAPMRLEPENSFLDAPLNTLQAIKDQWHADANTCINISSADMLQFAIFFAVTRQRGTPESLLSGTPSANLKRQNLVTEFKWGRPDELNCDTMWVGNLPGFQLSSSGPLNAGRCTGASEEIQEKMMNRNGFTAEEATALIGAHTIGLIRNSFGASLAGAWVTNGEDNATPDGPVFDNSYHDFLINTIVQNTCPDFVASPLSSIAPFNQIFPDWFRDSLNDLDHLDTDIALAFPPVASATHPDFRVHSTNFALNNANFLNGFDAALEKMSHLGVNAPTLPASECENPCGGSGSGGVGGGGGHPISVTTVLALAKKLGNATAFADAATFDIQEGRAEEMKNLTTPIETETTTTTATRPVETKPTQTKPIETKPTQTKPIETKQTQTKPIETKQTQTRPVDKSSIRKRRGDK